MCVWLACACRDNADRDIVGTGSPVLEIIKSEPGRAATLAVTIDVTPDTHTSSKMGQCWTAMVRNPIISSGYPVPRRDDALKTSGLEVSLDLMVAMSRAWFPTTFDTAFLLKGVVSALVATAHTETAIMWHFVINSG